MIAFVYKLFIGILLATTLGMGIAAFYPAPTAPEYPQSEYISKPEAGTPQNNEKIGEFERESKAYDTQRKRYDRDVAVAAVALSLVTLVISLTVLVRFDVIADGIVLGSMLTLLYGIIRSFGSGEEKFIFLTTLAGFTTVLILGYINFVRPAAKLKSKG